MKRKTVDNQDYHLGYLPAMGRTDDDFWSDWLDIKARFGEAVPGEGAITYSELDWDQDTGDRSYSCDIEVCYEYQHDGKLCKDRGYAPVSMKAMNSSLAYETIRREKYLPGVPIKIDTSKANPVRSRLTDPKSPIEEVISIVGAVFAVASKEEEKLADTLS